MLCQCSKVGELSLRREIAAHPARTSWFGRPISYTFALSFLRYTLTSAVVSFTNQHTNQRDYHSANVLPFDPAECKYSYFVFEEGISPSFIMLAFNNILERALYDQGSMGPNVASTIRRPFLVGHFAESRSQFRDFTSSIENAGTRNPNLGFADAALFHTHITVRDRSFTIAFPSSSPHPHHQRHQPSFH